MSDELTERRHRHHILDHEIHDDCPHCQDAIEAARLILKETTR